LKGENNPYPITNQPQGQLGCFTWENEWEEIIERFFFTPESGAAEFKATPCSDFHSISNNFIGVVGGLTLFKILKMKM
jgi:hypothetical protein